MKQFLFLFLVLVLNLAQAGNVWYFGNGEAVNLTDGIAFKNGLKMFSGPLDPSTSAVNAPAGSHYLSSNGTTYVKQDAGSSTNWLPVGVSAPASLTAINGQSGPSVTIAAGTSGTDFAISSAANTITLNLPTASASNRGALSTSDWSTFNGKEPAITGTTSADYYRGDKTFQPLNKAAVGLSNVDNTSDASKPVSTATQTALDLKADLNSPTFTGTVSGITKSMVGLGNVDNTSDANKPVSTATQTALDLKADLNSPTFTGTVSGITKSMVGLGNVDNTSDANKPVSTATQTALDAKVAGPAASVDGEIALYDSTTGKLIKRATGTGVVKAVSGVYGTGTVGLTTEVSGTLPIANGGTNNNSLSVTAGKVVYGDGSKLTSTAVGTTSQVLYGGTTPAFGAPQISVYQNGDLTGTLYQQIRFPNLSMTAQGSATVIDTDENNWLPNGSFEAGTYDDGWTNSGTATEQVETATVWDGQQSIKITTSGSQTINLTKTTTLYAVEHVGNNCMASVKGLTNMTAGSISICAMANSAATSDCETITAQDAGRPFQKNVFFVCDGSGTNNGISITGTFTDATGTFFDKATVGSNDKIVPSASAYKIGSLKYQVANCSWAKTSAGEFAVDADCVADGIEGRASAPSTKIPGITILNAPPGDYEVVVKTSDNISGSPADCYWTIGDSSSPDINGGYFFGNLAEKRVVDSMRRRYSYTASGDRTFRVQIYAISGSPTCTLNGGAASPTLFDVYYYPPVTTQMLQSQCGANCVDTFSANITAADSLSNENTDWISGTTCTNATTGTATCTFNSGVFTQTPNCTCSQSRSSTNADSSCAVMSVSSSAVTFQTNNNGALSDQAMFISCQKAGADFTATRLIQGTFKNMSKYPGINSPKTCLYYFGGASATLASPTECTSGTCVEVYDSCGTVSPPAYSGTATYIDTTFASGTWANSTPLYCECQGWDTTTATGRKCHPYFTTSDNTWATTSSGGYVLGAMVLASPAGTSGDGYVMVQCVGESP